MTLLYISYIDIRKKIISNKSNLIILFLGILKILIEKPNDVINIEIVSIMLLPVFMILTNVLFKNAFGGGDIKFMAAIGIYLGAEKMWNIFYIGIIISGIYAVFLILVFKKTAKDKFALGPFLVFGALMQIMI